MNYIKNYLKSQKEKSLLRTLKPIDKKVGPYIYIKGKPYIDFSSNDYLGFARHEEIKKSVIYATKKYGVGASASRLLTGDYELFHTLEDKIAHLKGKESALLFNSGYQANVGIIKTLNYDNKLCVLSDKLCHASIIDGIMLSGAEHYRFKHNDLSRLEALLNKNNKKRILIVTETVFSMEGDIAPLKEIVLLKNKYKAELFVDEAHATGIFGKNGGGITEEYNLSNDIEYIMGTFGKALGSFGAYLAMSKENKDFFINTCRSFIYTTALPLPIVSANIKSIELLKKEKQRRKTLLEDAEYLRSELKKLNFIVRGTSQIVPIIIKDNDKTVKFAHELFLRGYNVLPIRQPTVPPNESRLRISVTYNHSKKMLKELVNELKRIKL